MALYRENRRRHDYRRLVATSLLCVIYLTALPISAQEVDLVFRNNPVGVRDTIILNLFVDHPVVEEVSVEKLELPESVTLLTGPSRRPYASGSSPDQVRINYTFRAETSGRKIIPEIHIRIVDRIVKTEPTLLEVGLYQNRRIYMPLQTSWQIPAGEILVGQATPVLITIDDLTEIPLTTDFAVGVPKDALLEEVPGLGEIRETSVGDIVLYQVPVASFLLTPSRSGRVTLPSATVFALDLQSKTGTLALEVKALPDELVETGAIGDFIFSAHIKRSGLANGSPASGVELDPAGRLQFAEGEEFVLHIRVEGVGNLNYLRIPEPSLEGAMVLDSVELSEMSNEEAGYRGWREVTYRIVAGAPGIHALRFLRFAWLNPKSGNIIQFDHPPLVIEVKAHSRISSSSDDAALDGEDEKFEPMSVEQVLRLRPHSVYANPLHYLWLLPLPIGFTILLVLKRSGVILATAMILLSAVNVGSVPDTGALQRGIEEYESEDYQSALASFKQALPSQRDYAGVHYNIALAEYRLENFGSGITFSRSAVKLRPMNRELWSFMRFLNREAGHEDLVAPSIGLHPDVPFFFLVFGIAASFSCLILLLVRSRGGVVIAFVLTSLLALTSGGLLAYTVTKNNQLTGIVYQTEAEARRIPRAEASEWFSFLEGQSLRVLDETESYYLVETAFNLKAWIEKGVIVFDGEELGKDEI